MKPNAIAAFMLVLIFSSCGKKEQCVQKTDQIYSRHLQRQVDLSIIATPLSSDKDDVRIVIFNDGQDLKELGIAEIMDSLWDKRSIRSTVIVGVHAGNRMQEYGVAGYPDYEKRGSKAEDYGQFINNELYPYAKKMCGVRKFRNVTIGGWSLGGLSAFDVAWTYADKINKVGVFSGSFWWRDKDSNDSSYADDKNRIILKKLRASRKKPDLAYWFLTGALEETADRDSDGISDVIDDTRDLINYIKTSKNNGSVNIQTKETQDGKHELASWVRSMPEFLVWACKD